MTEAINLADIAAQRQALAARGYRPVPLYSWNQENDSNGRPIPRTSRGKRPFGNEWAERARRNPPEAATVPPTAIAANTGVLCDGLRVIDIDVDDPIAARRVSQLAEATLGSGLVRSRPGSGRCAILYAAAEDEPGKRVTSGPLGKIEVLGRGQQLHALGPHYTGVELVWSPAPPTEYPRDALPTVSEAQITDFLSQARGLLGDAPTAPESPPLQTSGGEEDWVIQASLLQAISAVSEAPEGSRNDTLNQQAFRLGRYVALGLVEESEVVEQLTLAAEQAGLELGEITGTIASGLRGARKALQAGPSVAAAPPAAFAPFGILTRGSIDRWIAGPPPPPAFIIQDFVEQGAVALLAGEGGAGKSYIALLAASAVATGHEFLGKRTVPGRAVCLFAEDSEGALHARLSRICKARGVALAALGGTLFPVSTVDDPMDARTLWSAGKPTMRFALLEQELGGISDLKLLVLDNVTMMFDGNEIDRREVGGFLSHLGAVARRLNIGIILIHHASKSNDGTSLRMASGSTAWIAQVRAAAELRKAADGHPPRFAVRKINNGREWSAELFWTSDGVLLPMTEAGAQAPGGEFHQQAFLACLRAITARKDYARASRQSPNYAPKMFTGMREACGATRGDLEQAMNNLRDAGHIMEGEVGKAVNRQRRIGLMIVATPSDEPDG